jgi:hypothetical protein
MVREAQARKLGYRLACLWRALVTEICGGRRRARAGAGGHSHKNFCPVLFFANAKKSRQFFSSLAMLL